MGFNLKNLLFIVLYTKDVLSSSGILLQLKYLKCPWKSLIAGYNLELNDCFALCGITNECQGICYNANKLLSCNLVSQLQSFNMDHKSNHRNNWKYFEVTKTVCDSAGYGYHREMEVCLRYYHDNRTWVTAEKVCERDNGTLINIQNHSKGKIFARLMKYSEVKDWFFVGLRNRPWRTGEELTEESTWVKDSFLDNKDPDHPNDTDCSCGVISKHISPFIVYLDGSCHKRYGKFVCEIVP